MNRKFYLLLLAPVIIFASCSKSVPETQANIVGNWRIVSVERQTQYGTQPVYTGYENGTFYFYNGGNAEYSDHIGQMDGTWRIVQRSDGYYDYNGNWRNDLRYSLELRLYDYYYDDAIEWEFYSIELSGGRMVGYMNRYGEDYRYEFRRY
ncbi:MAG TPA: hypothetical protein VGD17_04330 [Chitinophagaceae bacterium]